MSTKDRFLTALLALRLSPASVARATVLQEQTQGPVTFVSGGVGDDEAAAFRKAAWLTIRSTSKCDRRRRPARRTHCPREGRHPGRYRQAARDDDGEVR
jgi:hypothetical protein